MDPDSEIGLVAVSKENRNLITRFLEKLGSSKQQFRYFNHRNLEVLDNHLVTLLFLRGNEPVAYGHLDEEDNVVWLGIAVTGPELGKGYGRKMMEALFDEARRRAVRSISLTVDTDNASAIGLYEKFGFERISENTTKQMYLYRISL